MSPVPFIRVRGSGRYHRRTGEALCRRDSGVRGRELRAHREHNVLESAEHRKAILFGPRMHNFHQISAALPGAVGALQAQKPKAVGSHLSARLQHQELHQALGEAVYRGASYAR